MRVLALLFLSLVSNFASCQCSTITTTKLIIAVDQTDKAHLDAFNKFRDEELNNLHSFIKNHNLIVPCKQLDVVLFALTDLGANRPIRFGTGALPSDISKKTIMSKTVPRFRKNLHLALDSISTDSGLYKLSKIYEPLCLELTSGYTHPDNTVIIFFTDAIESSPTISFYRTDLTDVEAIESKLIKSCSCIIPKRKRTFINFVSYRFSENDKYVSKSSFFWKSFFRKKGAKIICSPSLQLDRF